jgi:putative sterol carrier protein
VPVIGTEEWVDALDAALRALPVATAADVVVQQELTDAGEAWHVVVSAGRAAARTGRHASPDVVLTQDVATALAVNAGELSAQTAFIDGRLRVRGDVGRLRQIADLLGALGAVPAEGGR